MKQALWTTSNSVLGSKSPCSKSVVYLNPVNGGSINADRDVKSHQDRRRLWERALSASRLPTYIPVFVQHTLGLVSALHLMHGEAVLVNHYIRLFTFDVMGGIGFGRAEGFNGLATGSLHTSIATLIDMMGIGVYMIWLSGQTVCLSRDESRYRRTRQEFRRYTSRRSGY